MAASYDRSPSRVRTSSGIGSGIGPSAVRASSIESMIIFDVSLALAG